MIVTEMVKTTRDVMNHDNLRTPSLRPIISMTSLSLSSFSSTIALTVMATENSQASVIDIGSMTIIACANL